MTSKASLVAAGIASFVLLGASALPRRAPVDPCRTGLTVGDTATFVGVSKDSQPPGELRLWIDHKHIVHYAESWQLDTLRFTREGEVHIGTDGMPHGFVARHLRNGVLRASESMERRGDSVLIVRDGQRSTEPLKPGDGYLPDFRHAPAMAVLAQCVLRQAPKAFRTARFGTVRAEQVSRIALTTAGRSTTAFLVLLRSDSLLDLAHIWLDETGRILAYPNAEGVMDLVRPELISAKEQLLQAELRAAQPGPNPTCGGGFGVGSCEHSRYLCKLTTPGGMGGSIQLADSGYSVRSDGLGPYISGSLGTQVLVGPLAGLFLGRGGVRVRPRAFTVDLSRPVPGDIGVPLGVVRATGWPGNFIPAGGDYFVEIAAQWYTEADYTQHSLLDIPIGSTVQAEQLDLNFYIDGLHHVLQMGPQPTGHCFSDGTAIHGDGTTRGTITRPTPTRWVVDLPPGSIGRLFQVDRADKHAINRGLYYVSLHFELQR